MKYLCEGCERLVEAGSLRLEGGQLVLTCARCSAATRADAPWVMARPEGAWVSTTSTTSTSSAPAAAPPAPPAPGGTEPRAGSAPTASPALRVVPLPREERRGGEVVRSAAEAARADDPFEAPDTLCPKCFTHRVPGAPGCSACGLVFARFRREEHQPSDALTAAWREALAAWDAPEAHERVLQVATARDELAQLGRLYRLRLAMEPGDPQALAGREEVLRRASVAATLALETRKLAGPEAAVGARRLKAVAAVLLAALVVALLFVTGRLLLGGARG